MVDDVDTEPRLTAVQETPTNAAARILELAGVTAERLVADAETEAKSLVIVARDEADAILRASRNEADQIATDLARAKTEQADELRRERVTTLAELSDKKAALEAQIIKLRERESLHRDKLRLHLTEQLFMLDSMLPQPPAGYAG